MKTLIVAISMMAASAFAGDNLLNYGRYDGVSTILLCDAGTHFRTINPMNVCTQWKETSPAVLGGEVYAPATFECVATQPEFVTVSKTGATCEQYDQSEVGAGCLKWGTAVRSNTVLAEKIIGYKNEASYSEYFYHVIPACQTQLNPKPAK